MRSRKTTRLVAIAATLAALVAMAGSEAWCLPTCGTSISSACIINGPGAFTVTAQVMPGSGDAIQIGSVTDVTINLNGWSVGGGTGGEAINAGAGSSGYAEDVRVANGHIRGSGSAGIDVDMCSDIEQVQATSNNGYGIWPTGASIIYQNIAYYNANDGISLGADSVVMENVSASNTGLTTNGISTGYGGVVADNTLACNPGYQLKVGSYAGYGRNVLGTAGTGCAGSCVNGGQTMYDNECNNVKQ